MQSDGSAFIAASLLASARQIPQPTADDVARARSRFLAAIKATEHPGEPTRRSDAAA
jgi:hypothetical protein